MHVVLYETDHSISKIDADDLECDDLKSVLNKNELIHIDTADSHAVQEPTVSAGFPKE